MKGGLELRMMIVLNQALRSKLVWKMAINDKRDWIKVCITKYMQDNHIYYVFRLRRKVLFLTSYSLILCGKFGENKI